jgi:dTMP kinase
MRYKDLRMFITFEGIEGVGKTTQIKLIEDFFKNEGTSYVLTREPGGLAISEKIRSILLHEDMDPLTELFLYEAARAEHFIKIIKNEKRIVLCDRFTDATIAYQGYGRNLSIELVEKIKSYCNIWQKT